MHNIIAIDGPASSGKSTLANLISKNYDVPVLHSGKIYRALAVEMLRNKININSHKEIIKCVSNISYESIASKNLYTSEIDLLASNIAIIKPLRKRLLEFQRDFYTRYIKKNKFVVVEGRDMGTVVFPDARIKLFIWAKAEIRAERRHKQLRKSAKKTSYKKVLQEINLRDNRDFHRKVAPLKPAVNSVLLDTSYLDIEQVFKAIKKTLIK